MPSPAETVILPQPAELLRTIEAWRSSSGAGAVEVAFYGGTFTALSRRQQESLLQPLQPLLASGRGLRSQAFNQA